VTAAGTARRPPAALVTGANRGLGLALATELLADRGGSVVLGVRDPGAAGPAQDLVAGHPDRAWLVRVDYADEHGVVGVTGAVPLDALDLLVNCGGANLAVERPPAASKGPVGELCYSALVELFEVNVAGPVLLCQALWPLLTAAGGSVVANVSTGRASLALGDQPGSFGYSVSKAALNMATRKLAAELGRLGGTAVAIDPGWMRTRMGGPNAPNEPADVARRMLDTLLAGGRALNGRFVDADGNNLPW
jgi:NAD(P)-dependent dehydrogenase (short-subunit alcohol dehydrogenase family)